MVQAVAKRPGIFETVAGSWRSTLGALVGMLPLFAIVTAAVFGLNYAFPILEQKLAIIRPARDSIFVLMVVNGAWLFALEKLALGLAVAPAALATMRHVLIDDGWRLSPGPLMRFWCWTAAMLVVALGSLYVSGLAAAPSVQLISILLECFAVLVPLLMLMIFPAVAADEPVTGILRRFDQGLERWDGNIWRIAIVMALTAGPGLLLQRLPAAIIMRQPGATDDMVQKFAASLAGSITNAALTVLLVVIASSGLAWCFTVAKMPKPARVPLGTVVPPEAARK